MYIKIYEDVNQNITWNASQVAVSMQLKMRTKYSDVSI